MSRPGSNSSGQCAVPRRWRRRDTDVRASETSGRLQAATRDKDRPLGFRVPQTRCGKQRAWERQRIITAFPELPSLSGTGITPHCTTMSSTGTFRGTPKGRPQSVYSESPSVANSNIPRPKLETVQSEASTSHSAVRAKQSKRDEVCMSNRKQDVNNAGRDG